MDRRRYIFQIAVFFVFFSFLQLGGGATAFAAELTDSEKTNIDVYGTSTTVYKISDDFYQDAATYDDSKNFYITGKSGLKYFQNLINGGEEATDYVGKCYTSTTVNDLFQTNIFSNRTVHLLADIDLESEDWKPIGYVESCNYKSPYFYGSFDGHNHTISNLKAVPAGDNDKCFNEVGLFGRIQSEGSFSNITLHNVSADGVRVGALIGFTHSNFSNTFTNCHVTGSININGSYEESYKKDGAVGGLVGYGYTLTFENCTINGDNGTIKGTNCPTGLFAGAAFYSGTFSKDYSVSGLTATEDEVETVKMNGASVAMIADDEKYTTYGTLARAITAAQNGDTIELISDVELTDRVWLPSGITIDGQGFTIKPASVDAFNNEKLSTDSSYAASSALTLINLAANITDVTIKNVSLDSNQLYPRALIGTGAGSSITLSDVVLNHNSTTIRGADALALNGNCTITGSFTVALSERSWSAISFNTTNESLDLTGCTSFIISEDKRTGTQPVILAYLDGSNVTGAEALGLVHVKGTNVLQTGYEPESSNKIGTTYTTKLTSADESVTCYTTFSMAMNEAVDDGTLTLLSDISADISSFTYGNVGVFTVNKKLTIDGDNHTVEATGTSSYKIHVFDTYNEIAIKNLTIDGAKKSQHGLQAFGENAKLIIENVTSINNKGYGLVVNGSTVSADNLYTSSNDWGGVNVDSTESSHSPATFTMTSGNISEDNSVKLENSYKTENITLNISGGIFQTVSYDVSEDSLSTIIGNITGGRYKNDVPEKLLASGYISLIDDSDGYYIVTTPTGVVKTAPTLNTGLIHTGETHALITAGEALTGTMYYALGTNSQTAPASDDYSVDVPQKSELGTYYVWYKVAYNGNDIYETYLGSVSITDAAPTIANNTLTVAKGQSSSLEISDTTGTGTRNWTLNNGAPTWITIKKDSDSKATITAAPTVDISSGTYTYGVTITNADDNSLTDSATITITVTASKVTSGDQSIENGNYTGTPSAPLITRTTTNGQSETLAKFDFMNGTSKLLETEIAITTESTDFSVKVSEEFLTLISIDVSVDVIDPDFKNYCYSLDVNGLPEGLELSGDLLISDDTAKNFQHVFSIYGTSTTSTDAVITIQPYVTVSSDTLALISTISKDITLSIVDAENEPEPEPEKIILEAITLTLSGEKNLSLDVGTSKDFSPFTATVNGNYSDGTKIKLPTESYDLTYSTTESFTGITLSADGTISVTTSADVGVYEIPVKAVATVKTLSDDSEITVTLTVNNVAPVLEIDLDDYEIDVDLSSGNVEIETITITAIEGLTNLELKTSGELPEGLTVSSTDKTVIISGIVIEASEIGIYNYTVTASNDVGTDEITISFNVHKLVYVTVDDNGKATINIDTNSLEPDQEFTLEDAIASLGNASGIIKDAEEISISNGITSLQGIEQLTNLKSLDLTQANSLTEVTITSESSVQNIDLTSNQSITKLNLKDSTSIQKVEAQGSNLEDIDIEGNTSIQTVNLTNTNVTAINAAGCTGLQELKASGTDLSSIDLTNCTQLKTLEATDTKLTALDLADCVNLESLNCNYSSLQDINLPNVNENLVSLSCVGNNLLWLDLNRDKCPKLSNFNGTGQYRNRIKLSSEFNFWEFLWNLWQQFLSDEDSTHTKVDYDENKHGQAPFDVSKISGVTYSTSDEGEEQNAEFNSNDGHIKFTGLPRRFSYNYDTGYRATNSGSFFTADNEGIMDVTISSEGSEDTDDTEGNDRLGPANVGCNGGFELIALILLFALSARKR